MNTILKLARYVALAAALALPIGMLSSPEPARAQAIGGAATVSSTNPTAARVALPANRSQYPFALIVPAPGTSIAVYYALGDNTVAATTSSPVLPLGGICINFGPATNLSILASASSANVNVTQVTSCPTFSDSGGSGGGGGSPSGPAGGVLSGTYPNPGFASIVDQRLMGNVSGGSAGQIALTQAQVLTFLGGTTGTGALVRATSPTLVTPVLGVATATSVAIGAGSAITSSGPGGALTALAYTAPGTGVATALGVNVGSAGAIVVNGGALGTPSSGTLTNATGLPLGGITGFGTGVATALGNTAGGAGGFALVGTTPPTGAAGGSLAGTYPNPTLAAVNSIGTSLAIGGATIGADALGITGSASFSGMLTVNQNAASPPAAISGNGVRNVAADSIVARSTNYSFGAIAAFTVARANGTGASPTAVVSGNQIGGFNSYGYATSGGAAYYGPTSSVQSFATENFTSTAQGTKVVIATTPNTMTTLTTALTIDQDQSVAAAGRFSAATSAAIAGCTISTDALCATGTATVSGQLNAASFVPTGSTVPTNGMYLSAANTLGFAISSARMLFVDSNGIQFNNANGAQIFSAAASSTVATLIPRRADGSTGVGSNGTGTVSLISSSTERVRVATNAASVSDVLVPGTTFTGGSATTTFPQILVQPTGTSAVTSWSTSGTILGMNVVSGFAGNFFDFHIAGSTSFASLSSGGNLTVAGAILAPNLRVNSNTGLLTFGASNDLIVSRPSAASFQLGNIDVDTNASIVAQTLRTQGALTGGTTNQAGKDFTILVSPGKGTGAGGSFIVQTAPAGSTGSTPNAGVTRLTIDSTGLATFGGAVAAGGNAITAGNFISSNAHGLVLRAGAGSMITDGGSATTLAFYNNANTDAPLVQFGGTTSSFPAIKRTTTALNVRLADDSADAKLTVGDLTASTANVLFTALANSATTSAVCYNTGTGALTYNSTVGTCTVSTIAAKDLVAPLTKTEGHRIVMAMQAWRYDLKPDRPTYLPGEQIGLVAQDVDKVDSRLVAKDPDGRIAGVRYEQYTAAITAAIQYQDEEIRKLKADNDNLRAEMHRRRASK